MGLLSNTYYINHQNHTFTVDEISKHYRDKTDVFIFGSKNEHATAGTRCREKFMMLKA